MIFNGDRNFDHTIDIYTSDNGSEGTIVSINRAALLSALTLQRQTMAHISQSYMPHPPIVCLVRATQSTQYSFLVCGIGSRCSF